MRRAVTPVCVTLSLSSRTHVIRHLSLPAECARVGGSLQVMTTCHRSRFAVVMDSCPVCWAVVTWGAVHVGGSGRMGNVCAVPVP